MKRLLPALTGLCLLLSITVYADAPSNTALTTDTEKLSYAMGYKTGAALKAQSITIDSQQFYQGLDTGYQGKQSAMSDQDMQTVLTNMQQQMAKKMQQQYTQASTTNLQAGNDFLAKNAKLPGVVTTASGLQYQVVTPGTGASPTANDTVTVNYEGKLIDGTVFDSSYKRGQPATFKVGDVIPGWQEALQLMKPGATYMLYIPAKLAYGAQGSMGAIGPNETLIFKVNLISVKKT